METITSELIKKILKTKTFGKTIYSFEEIGSTNEVAYELARNGALEGTIIIADSQTKGRGRLKRRWISPPGVNLYMSVIFRPSIATKDAPFLTLVTAIAIADTIKNNEPDTFIKWPNDVLIKGKKVAGVLTDMQPVQDKVDFIVVGIGVNINMTKEMMEKEMKEISDMTTSLREALGHEIDRTEFAADLIVELEIWYQKFLKEGSSRIIKEWTRRWGAINRRVLVKFDGKEVEGIASGIDENGFLVVQKNDGTIEKIIAGDVIIL
ncbi:MAG TPA: biotin--[acetyl-CoA-carboxylase] ligase [Thermodesulfobacteriota bacterium]